MTPAICKHPRLGATLWRTKKKSRVKLIEWPPFRKAGISSLSLHQASPIKLHDGSDSVLNHMHVGFHRILSRERHSAHDAHSMFSGSLHLSSPHLCVHRNCITHSNKERKCATCFQIGLVILFIDCLVEVTKSITKVCQVVQHLICYSLKD